MTIFKNKKKDKTIKVINSEQKLTKQQKRDLKKNSKNNVKSTIDNNNLVKDSVSVYKRVVDYPLEYPTNNSEHLNRFVVDKDSDFNNIMSTSYKGFVTEDESSFDVEFHQSFQNALEGLELLGNYQFDITQPGGLGTKTAKTYVTRCLVGDAGITYKYLGIRMFSIPWEKESIGSSEYSIKIGELNKILINHSKGLLDDMNRSQTGSCEYNLTLINRCSWHQYYELNITR